MKQLHIITDEIWIKCLYENYEVSNMGRVRSTQHFRRKISRVGKEHLAQYQGKILKTFKNQKGYESVRLSIYGDGTSLTQTVHKLVMLSFKGPRPEGYQINHINGIKTDNKLENLEWATQSGNMKHAYKLGLKSMKGELNPKSKLKVKDIIEIRTRRSNREKIKDLAVIYGVSTSQITEIVKRRSWRSVA